MILAKPWRIENPTEQKQWLRPPGDTSLTPPGDRERGTKHSITHVNEWGGNGRPKVGRVRRPDLNPYGALLRDRQKTGRRAIEERDGAGDWAPYSQHGAMREMDGEFQSLAPRRFAAGSLRD